MQVCLPYLRLLPLCIEDDVPASCNGYPEPLYVCKQHHSVAAHSLYQLVVQSATAEEADWALAGNKQCDHCLHLGE